METKPLRIAIVLNRFYPEVGGAETNLFFQACQLAKRHAITVFTPKRLATTPAREKMEGFEVRRLRDVRNLRGRYPNLKTNTLMPGIFFRILFGKFDAVMAFPSLNRSNQFAMLAAKIRRIPFVLCSFDLLDYAQILEKTGKIDPHCLDNYSSGRFRAWLLSKCDHIFAISNREIAFFKRYNKSVSYSPVPVKPEEYEAPVNIDVRKKYGIGEGTMLYFCLGRVSKIKGQDLAAEAFVRLAKDVPDSVLVIVGRADYEPEFVEAMKRHAREAGVENRMIFTGMVEREEVLAFLKQGDVHVIPVRFMNSGAVVVETWAANTPVIQSDAVDPNFVKEG